MAHAQHRRPEPLSAVLLATDFSPGARLAEERVPLLPLDGSATVDVLHVIPDGGGADERLARAQATALVRRVVARLQRRLGGEGNHPRVAGAVAVGDPHVEIVRRARAAGVDLVVLGCHGRRRPAMGIVGTTAGRVVRHGDTPVLTVRARAAGPYRRAMVGVDLEDWSSSLAALAGRLAPADGEELFLVHACWGSAVGRFIASVGRDRERAGDRRAESRAAAAGMEALRGWLARRLPGHRARTLVFHGDPHRILPAQARRLRADLLALGTHGRSGLARILLGSVAEHALEAASCDVLTARPARFTFRLP